MKQETNREKPLNDFHGIGAHFLSQIQNTSTDRPEGRQTFLSFRSLWHGISLKVAAEVDNEPVPRLPGCGLKP
jgi:hypothetical protein